MTFKDKLHEIIFGTDTWAGKWFDILLIIAILASIATGMLESVQDIQEKYGIYLNYFEWIFTIIFTLEYFARIYAAHEKFKYIKSYFGIIDILAVLPSYISAIFPTTQYLSVIRVLRVLRVFRILKLAAYLKEYNFLINSINNSMKKITVFILGVLTLVTILGSIMYIVEPASSGFTSIPKSIYWSIVTLTTVGYGDIYPKTNFGQFLAGIVMILGYAIIAVPAGLVTSEMVVQKNKEVSDVYCKRCGELKS